MIGSWELEHLSKPEHFVDLAKAYLESSILLCSEMSKGSFPSTYSHAQVVLFLSHHSVELFLKGGNFEKFSESRYQQSSTPRATKNL
jgi:hypothetical protein